MSILSAAALKAKFATGDIPSGADFIDLIDTLLDVSGGWPAVLPAADAQNLSNLNLPDPLPARSAKNLYNVNPSDWLDLAEYTPVYSDPTTFVLTGDQTARFKLTKRLRLTVNGAYEYTTPLTATYDGPTDSTTVTIVNAMSDVTLTEVAVSIFDPYFQGGAVSPEMVGVNTTAITAAGTNDYTAVLGITDYDTGYTYAVNFPETNDSPAPTIDIDGAGQVTIKKGHSLALHPGDLPKEALLRFDGTDMILVNPTPVHVGHEAFCYSDTAPPGYLFENGSLYSMTTYRALDMFLGGTTALDAGVTCTFDNTTNTVNDVAHGLTDNTVLRFTNSGGALPAELTARTTRYFVINATADTYQLSLTKGGAAVAFTDDGTGTHSYHLKFATPDPRGRAIRVTDDGAGVDPDAATRTDRGDGVGGDVSGSKQADEIISHKHGSYGLANSSSLGVLSNNSWYTITTSPDYTGGNETRMINEGRHMIIKY